MNVSLTWLCDHIDLSGKSVEEIDEMLTFSGVEVEGVQSVPSKVVVARVQSSEKHPDADRLSVCQVDDGSGKPRQIVCGAKNYTVGDNVPLALPGCRLGDFKIKSSKMRGVKSDGMLCSASELGLEDGVDGLMILDPSLEPGTPLTEVFAPVFELEVTPNRPDCLSHLGIARELSVLSGNSLKGVTHHAGSEIPGIRNSGIGLSAPDACPLYTARMIRGVKVGESPAWLKAKLTSIGLRPINNVVDITNYVLMEMGQPLHAFDADKLSGDIDVRMASQGEKFLALDGETYELTGDDLVIADSGKAVAIAGVMGGEETGVVEATTDVLLESAYFHPPCIRRTSSRLNLSSDSSYRFERGVDPHQVMGASVLATRLILELAGGAADDEILVAGQPPTLVGEITLDHDRVDQLMGTGISDDEITRILGGLGLEKLGGESRNSRWKIPSFRLDLQRPVDLIEEIARVYGLDKVPSKKCADFADVSEVDRFYDFATSLGGRLTDLGFYEARTMKLVSERQLSDHVFPREGCAGPVRLKNPLTDDFTCMRPGLIPGLLAVAERNIRMGADILRFFEIGTAFDSSAGESQLMGLLVSGPETSPTWKNPDPAPSDFFGLIGVVSALDAHGRINFRKTERDGLLLAVEIYCGVGKNSVRVGCAGQLAPARVRDLDGRHPVYVAEIDLEALQNALGGTVAKFEEMPKFPAVTRDVAMEVASDLPNGEIESFFASLKEELLESFRLFDVFSDPEGVKLASDRKSVAYSLTYRSPFRTLQQSEVDDAHGGILEKLQKALPVSLR